MAEEQKKAEKAQPPKAGMQVTERKDNMIRALVPSSENEVSKLAQVIAISGMAPKSYQDNDIALARAKISVGIIAGMEIGLAPMQALQSIAVVNGNPSLWGDAALALVMSSGLLEDIDETCEFNHKGEPEIATCTVKRKGFSEKVRTFGRAQAAKAGLLSKSGPWTQYPDRMMQMRARSKALRDVFPDILKGFRFAEEVRDIEDDPDLSITPPPPPKREDYMAAPAEPEVVDVDVEEDAEAEAAEPVEEPVQEEAPPKKEPKQEKAPEPEPAGDLDEDDGGSPLFVTFDHDGSQMAEYTIASDYAKGLLSLFNELEPEQYAAFREANMETVKVAFKELPDDDTKADLKDMARKWREGQ